MTTEERLEKAYQKQHQEQVERIQNQIDNLSDQLTQISKKIEKLQRQSLMIQDTISTKKDSLVKLPTKEDFFRKRDAQKQKDKAKNSQGSSES